MARQTSRVLSWIPTVEWESRGCSQVLVSNTSPTGSLDHDRFLHAMLQLRNTPDPDCNLSPVQIIFGPPLQGSF